MEFLNLLNDEVFQYFLIACNSIAFVVWLITIVTDKHSFMDKLWPILPGVYSWCFLFTSFYLNPTSKSGTIDLKTNITDINGNSYWRLILMTLLTTFWGLRLANYFWRRGYYKWDFEDHRWDLVKKRFNYPEKKVAFHIFNFFFMAFLQNWILLGYSLPLWYIQTHKQDPFNVLDIVITVLYLIFFLIEASADEQQWAFQSAKYKWIANEKKGIKSSEFSEEQIESFKRGFLCTGLFKHFRHPNYFGDIFLWWSMYAFTWSAQFSRLSSAECSMCALLNYSMFGTLVMTYLFQRSVTVSEIITKKKYPDYAHYQSQVGRIWPTLRAYLPKRD